MFSIRGSIIRGDDEKKNLLVVVSFDDYNKIIAECNALQHVFKNTSVQSILPCWKYEHEKFGTKYYAKILLSKARKDKYEELSKTTGEKLFRVACVPYSIEHSNTGPCNGVSLYYQGEYVPPKKFRVKQEKQNPTGIEN